MWHIVILLCLGHFAVDFMIGVWPVFKTIAHIDIQVAAIIAASSIFFGEFLEVLFGSLSDKGYQKYLIAIGPLLAGASAFFSYTDSFIFFFILSTLTFIGSAAFHPAAASALSLLDTKKKTFVMGCFSASGMFGIAVSQALFCKAYVTYSGETAFLGLPTIILFIAVLLLLKKAPIKQSHSKVSMKDVFNLFKEDSYRTLYIILLANQAVLWSFVFILPDILIQDNYPDWIALGGGHFVFMIGTAISPLLVGFLADRYSKKNLLFTLFGMQILLLNGFITIGTIGTELLLSSLFILGLFFGGIQPIIWSTGNSLSTKNRGLISAFLMGLVWIVAEGVGIGSTGIIAGILSPKEAILLVGLLLFPGLLWISRFPATAQIAEELD